MQGSSRGSTGGSGGVHKGAGDAKMQERGDYLSRWRAGADERCMSE